MQRDLKTLLIAAHMVSEEQVQHAMQSATGTGCTWLEHLFINGLLDEERVSQCITRAFYVPQCDLRRLQSVHPHVIGMLPAAIAVEHRAIPVGLESDGYLRVVMLDPTDIPAQTEVGFFCGRPLQREVTFASAIVWALDHYYGVRSRLAGDVLWPRAVSLAG